MQPFATATWPLVGWRTVACQAEAVVPGDMTGASFYAEVRDREEGGALRIAIATAATSAAEGVRVVAVEVIEGLTFTTIGIRINEASMESLPTNEELGLEAGDPLELRWGMHMTPPDGGIKFMAFNGPFTVYPGVPA